MRDLSVRTFVYYGIHALLNELMSFCQVCAMLFVYTLLFTFLFLASLSDHV